MTNYEQYYKKSIEALTQYAKGISRILKRAMPTEKVWNKLASKNDYLTSQSLGYLSGIKFSDLCKDIYKKYKKEKM